MMIYVIIHICLYCTVVNLLLRRHSKMVLNNGWGYLITYFVMFPENIRHANGFQLLFVFFI